MLPCKISRVRPRNTKRVRVDDGRMPRIRGLFGVPSDVDQLVAKPHQPISILFPRAESSETYGTCCLSESLKTNWVQDHIMYVHNGNRAILFDCVNKQGFQLSSDLLIQCFRQPRASHRGAPLSRNQGAAALKRYGRGDDQCA